MTELLTGNTAARALTALNGRTIKLVCVESVRPEGKPLDPEDPSTGGEEDWPFRVDILFEDGSGVMIVAADGSALAVDTSDRSRPGDEA